MSSTPDTSEPTRETCSIFGTPVSPQLQLELVQIIAADPVEVTGPDDNWTQLRVASATSQLEVNRKMRTHGGDEVSKMILGAHNFFRTVSTTHESAQMRVLDLISNSNMVLGLIGRPHLSQPDQHREIIAALTKQARGLIFDGWGARNPDGVLLLDKDGKSEL